LKALLEAGFKGELYAVNPSGGEILGLEAYPNVKAIPDPLDYVIASIPAQSILQLLDDCAAKGVKAVHMFTAGFRETGTEEGRRLEAEIARKAKMYGIHIIGPNCIGVYSPKINMPYGMANVIGEVGPVAFISQSGGVGWRVVRAGVCRGITFSKGVSYGNGCDLDSVDYLEYFALDPETKIIGAYLEGVREGQRLVQLLQQVSPTKPVILWKGGRTEAGAAAAASHTGSLAASDAVWGAALKQAGAIKVDNVDELVDTILAFHHLPWLAGRNVALVSGLAAGGGGDSVSSADSCTSLGLNVPPFTVETRNQLKIIHPVPGTIFRNPLDLSGAGLSLQVLGQAIDLVGADPNVDMVIIQEFVDDIVGMWPQGAVEEINDIFVSFRQRESKPIVVVLPPGLAEPERIAVGKYLSAARIPVYPTLERAAKALANMNQYLARKS